VDRISGDEAANGEDCELCRIFAILLVICALRQ
jgi:hypothetical protein